MSLHHESTHRNVHTTKLKVLLFPSWLDYRLYTDPTISCGIATLRADLVVWCTITQETSTRDIQKAPYLPIIIIIIIIYFFPPVSPDSWINLLWNEHKG